MKFFFMQLFLYGRFGDVLLWLMVWWCSFGGIRILLAKGSGVFLI
jgi:hypothetical protein